jgi:predicted nucleic acid-binding protein
MKGSRRQFNERKLQQIIKELKIEIIDVNRNVSRKYAIIYLSLAKKGAKIPINDVWIAACCMEVGGTLLTRDQHFQHVEQIETALFTP